ncbi:MAG: helix-turn-helix transcriptional regulator [Tepidisphaeraceae bacterium]|jgi:DNA-binding CsgD family transcriptional regulator
MGSLSSAQAFISEEAWELLARDMHLSGRELQITRQVFDDRKEGDIAAGLAISPHTIHTHLDRLYHKLGVKSRVELVVRVMTRFLELTSQPDSPLRPICGRPCTMRIEQSGE